MKFNLEALEQILETIQSGESNVGDVAKWKQGCEQELREIRERLFSHPRFADEVIKEILGE